MPITLKSLDQVVERARSFIGSNKRVVIGVAGKPGAGKSTLTAQLIQNLPPQQCALVPMDGYHLSNKQLQRINLLDRKGAHNTFDVDGFVNLLERIVKNPEKDIYYPIFYREIEESYNADGVVLANTKIVITEGNYLLFNQFSWERVRAQLDEIWYLKIDDDLRRERLISRNQFHGKNFEESYKRVHGSDEINAQVVDKTIEFADVIIEL